MMDSLRAPVKHLESQVWEHRDQIDIYTTKGRFAIKKLSQVEVDHVVELQLLDLAWNLGVALNADVAPSGNTRGNRHRGSNGLSWMMALLCLQVFAGQFVNGVDNLNVTTRDINQLKKGPFTRFRNDYRKHQGSTRDMSLASYVSSARLANGSNRALWATMMDEGTWHRIEGAVVRSYEDLSHLCYSMPSVSDQANKALEAFSDELGEMIEKMKLDT
eukprot:TRINITY_DN9717_c0_g2_i1.p1 TRINITY_DN9717_c0_g2~~TRINITY_DN9717_c0_g2_i1.p1  ORF type:complete len:217 (+),score=21.71 TRINITY_DN9717_c0_g2_i1:68-718(+)